MRSYLILSIICFMTLCLNAQEVADLSKTSKVVTGELTITVLEEKPFTGYLVENYSNGKPKTWITMKNGLAHGQWQEWTENGQLRYNAFWKEGKGHGLWQYFYENGQLKYEEAYVMDVPTGISRAYFENGQLEHDYFWLNGKKHGVHRHYDSTGILLKQEVYEEGILISETTH